MAIDYEKEFKDFIRIVSHDVRAPVRHINDFYKFLIEDLDVTYTENQLELKGHLEDAISQLKSQMDALLAYSRTVNNQTHTETFNIARLVQEVVDGLGVSGFNTTHITQKIEKGFILTFNRDALRIALHETLKNSIIFCEEEPKITIALSVEDTGTLLTIIDNGVGIDERFIEDVFLPFRQLNPKGLYPGIGMGLTIARKAIRLSGGNMSILGGERTTVSIQLPLASKS